MEEGSLKGPFLQVVWGRGGGRAGEGGAGQGGGSHAAPASQHTGCGPGIAPGHLPHIFERFFRGDRARSREHGGSGLGLAICKRIVEEAGGAVGFETTAGKGTTFRLALPVAATVTLRRTIRATNKPA